MSFSNFINQGWNDHADHSAAVAARLPEGIPLADTHDNLTALANLATHVFGEHLGQWADGRAFIAKLRTSALFTAESDLESALKKMDKGLELNQNPNATLDSLTLSEQVGALCIASSAQLGQKNLIAAQSFFNRALEKVDQLGPKDPANRNVAVTSNNMASELESKPIALSADEVALMLKCGLLSRKCWELAGTWVNVERADYFMVNRFAKAGRPAEALKSALSCLEICLQNNADDFEIFFGYECLARAYKATAQEAEYKSTMVTLMTYFEKLTDSQKKTAQSYIDKIGTFAK